MSLSELRVIDAPPPQKSIERIITIALLLALHGAVLAVLLTAKVSTVPTSRGVREIILSLVRVKPVKPAKPETQRRQKTTAVPPYPSFVPPPAFQPPAQLPSLTGVGNALFHCDLGSLADMPPDQRANCQHLAIARPSGAPEVGMPKKLEARDEARWSAALAERRKPVRTPCVSLKQGPAALTGGKQDTIVMTDVLCGVKGLLNGFGGEK